MKFVLLDINNLVHRSKHVIKQYDSFDECVGMVLTIVFNSIRKSYEKFGAQHMVACVDSSSWRKDVYPEWKADRKIAHAKRTPKEKEEYEIINEVINDVRDFLRENTNVTVLEYRGIEADDFIARWVALHNNYAFDHVIVSADGDFKQLVRDHVDLYDPIRQILYTSTGVYMQDGKRPGKNTPTIQRYGETWKVKYNKKTGDAETFEPDWELFKVSIRGVKNNTRSAYPRVYETKMREAFNDMGGLKWNNFINSVWGPDDARKSVREIYDLNRSLMDLTAQPPNIKQNIDNTIEEALNKRRKQMVGAHFSRFCARYRLTRLSQNPNAIVRILSSPYDA